MDRMWASLEASAGEGHATEDGAVPGTPAAAAAAETETSSEARTPLSLHPNLDRGGSCRQS